MNKKALSKNSQVSKKSNNFFFVLLFVVMLLEQICAFCSRVVFLTNILPLVNIVAVTLICVLVFGRLLAQKRTLKELATIIALIFVALASYLLTGSMILFFLITMPLLAEGVAFRRIIKSDLIIKILLTTFIVVCYESGLTTEYSYFRNGVIRESLGFTHPNKLGYMALIIYLDAYYLLPKENSNIIKCALIAIIPLALCMLSDSRTALYAVLIIAMFSIFDIVISKFFKNKTKLRSNVFLHRMVLSLPIILIIASMASSFLYGQRNETIYRINERLSGRISLQNYYDNHYRYSLLGSAIGSDVLETNPLDNGYYRILHTNGIIGILALLIITQKSLKNAHGDKKLTIFLTTLLLYGLSEWMVFRLTITPFWMIAFGKGEKK